MANNRLALLSVLVLLGLIVPITGADVVFNYRDELEKLESLSGDEPLNQYAFRTDDELVKKLGEQRQKNVEIGLMLDVFGEKNRAINGDLTVQAILDRAGNNELTVEECLRNGIVRHNWFIKVRERLLAENVHKFIYQDLMTFCAENIEEVFEKSMQVDTGPFDIAKLVDRECTLLARAKELVNSIEKLSDTPLSKTFHDLLDERNLVQKQKQCMDKPIGQLQAHFDKLSQDEEKFERFREGVDKLGGGLMPLRMPTELFLSVPVEDRKHIEIAGVRLDQIIADSERENFSSEDCLKYGEVKHKMGASDRDQNLDLNVHQFRYHNLMLFCVKNIKEVAKKAMQRDGGLMNIFDYECARAERAEKLVSSIINFSNSRSAETHEVWLELWGKVVKCRENQPINQLARSIAESQRRQ